jgi:hypothetical protein
MMELNVLGMIFPVDGGKGYGPLAAVRRIDLYQYLTRTPN